MDYRELVVLAQAGDRDAFGELVNMFQNMVLGIAVKRMGNYNDANDLVQCVFINAMRKLYQLKEPSAFPGWLRKMTVRMAINARMRVKLPTRAFLADPQDRVNEPVDELIRAEDGCGVRAAIDKLKPIDRNTLVDFYLCGKTIVRMARDLRIPEGTVKRRLHVARNRLREVMAG